jgi:hypothetical protein
MLVETNTPKTNGLVSVVIVNYNVAPFLFECIRSTLPQVDEIIVIDNDSSDSSLELCAQQFADEPKLKLVRSKINRGFAIACNMGVMRARGDFIFFLNPDCYLNESAVSQLVQVLENNSDVGMVGGLLISPDGSEQGGGRRAIPTPWRSFVRAFGLSRYANRWPKLFFDFHLHKQPLPERPIEVEAISGACMLVKRTAIEDVGLWDEDYFLHCEDLDWCMRFRQKNWKIMFVPAARVLHSLGMSSQSRPVFVAWHKHKGMVHFYRKFFRHQYPSILMGLVMLGVWLRFILVVCYETVKRLTRFRHK